jgi:hypothetical protein
MSTQRINLPPSANCPGCGAIVLLPREPLFADTPPAICADCNTEVPDYRRADYDASVHQSSQTLHLPAPPPHFVTPPPPRPRPAPVVDRTPIEERRVSRGNLFRSIGGLIAERGADAVESAKGKIGGG